MRAILGILLFSLSMPLIEAQSAKVGLVDGTIHTSSGQAAEGVQVSVVPFGQESELLRGAKSDVAGHFKIADLPAGRYRVYLKDESRGVPDGSALIFQSPSTEKVIDVNIQSGAASHLAYLSLPAPLKELRIKVSDTKTGKPPAIVRCRLTRNDNPAVFIETGSMNGLLVFYLPSEKTQIKISSVGYKDWTFIDHNGDAFVELRENLHMDAKLRPIK